VHECLLWVLNVVRCKRLRRADPSSRGILLSECRLWSGSRITLYNYKEWVESG
jgi:hypothetical protein